MQEQAFRTAAGLNPNTAEDASRSNRPSAPKLTFQMTPPITSLLKPDPEDPCDHQVPDPLSQISLSLILIVITLVWFSSFISLFFFSFGDRARKWGRKEEAVKENPFLKVFLFFIF